MGLLISNIAAMPMLASILAENIPMHTLIIELVISALLLVLMFLFKRQFLKILCACGAEVCLWLACRMAFGDDFILTQIMTWLTALATILFVVAVVNRIDWGGMRSKK